MSWPYFTAGGSVVAERIPSEDEIEWYHYAIEQTLQILTVSCGDISQDVEDMARSALTKSPKEQWEILQKIDKHMVAHQDCLSPQ